MTDLKDENILQVMGRNEVTPTQEGNRYLAQWEEVWNTSPGRGHDVWQRHNKASPYKRLGAANVFTE